MVEFLCLAGSKLGAKFNLCLKIEVREVRSSVLSSSASSKFGILGFDLSLDNLSIIFCDFSAPLFVKKNRIVRQNF